MHFSPQDLWFNPRQSGAAAGDHVIVTTERGTEIGLVTQDPFEAPKEEVKGSLKPVLRVATDEDLARADELAERGEEAMPVFRALVKEHGLDMKPVGVEFLFGGEKAVFYFAAEDRVDFRDLVRELTSRFHQRIDMRQIGVRDEARLVGGYAPCGQELCCVRFGGEFEPVSIRMAKEQDLPLNSSKISGVCGRLMCCLRYEFEAYRDFKSRAPKKNALIDTPLGKAKVVEYNTPRETLLLRLENGKSFTVALKDMTCSEGCCKRAAEQKSPLRPDTVTREALEALGIPEIALQLADLDRVSDPNGYRLDDSLLEGRKRRRGGEAGQRAAAQGDAEVGGRSPRKRGKAGRPAGENGGEAGQEQAQAQPRQKRQRGAGTESGEERQQRPRGGGMKPRRDRRDRQNAAGGSGEAAPQQAPRQQTSRQKDAARQAGGEQQARRTRRHHSVSEQQPGAALTAAAGAQDGQRRTAESSPAREPRARRTGQDPARASRPEGQAQQQQRSRRQHHRADEGTPAKPPAQAADGTGATGEPQQRRRRRPGDKGGTARTERPE
jgi:cell fate regulator YaaT (PSP1 superfamily)